MAITIHINGTPHELEAIDGAPADAWIAYTLPIIDDVRNSPKTWQRSGLRRIIGRAVQIRRADLVGLGQVQLMRLLEEIIGKLPSGQSAVP